MWKLGEVGRLCIIASLLMLGAELVNGTLPDLECPEDCECHYFRINWVTDCSESNFTEIPHEGLSQNVYVLNMNSNNVTEVQRFPEDIKLRRLQLADNLLTKLSRESFAGLSYLLDADFSGNRITHVEPDAFRDSLGLITLEIQQNPLEPVDGPFLSSRSLMYLDLTDCHLTRLSTQFFSLSTSLNKLYLSGNPLGSIEEGIFDPLTSLEHLQLNRCNLTHIADKAFKNVTNLKTLELSGNYFTNVKWTMVLQNVALLEYLNLRNSALNNLPGDAFANNIWLRSLVLAENELRDLDVATTLGQNLQQLDTLDLSNCRLKGPLSEDAFANATKLRTLILSGNFLSAWDLSVALAPLTRLHKLSLKNCGLTRLPPNTFHRLTALEELDISRNPLNDAFTGILSPLETLKVLDMSYSNLSLVSRGTFSKMTHLRQLMLSGNRLTDLESGLFQNLTQLRTLELNDCGLNHPPEEDVFSAAIYEDFKELHLAGNPLVYNESDPLLPRQLKNVRVLDMSRCNLRTLPKDAFKDTPKITTLKLSGNYIGPESRDIEFVKQLPHLETLDLSNCMFNRLSPDVFSNNRNLTSLLLTGNPWKCDCNIYELWEWASFTKGNLAVLAGSTTSPEDLSTGSGKRKKELFCHYDANNFPSPKMPSTLRIKDLYAGRTWAKYVKESDCLSSRKPRAEKYMAVPITDGRTSFYIEDSPPTWLVAVACVAFSIFVGTVVGTAVVLLLKKFKKPNVGRHSMSATKLEDMRSVEETGVILTRRTN
jgi:Leucine-rich repeat (LRR) protein